MNPKTQKLRNAVVFNMQWWCILLAYLRELSEPDFMFSYSPVQYYSTYFMCKKDGAFSADENELHIFVRQDTYKKGELFQTTYSPLVFRNIVINADGTVDLEYEEGSASSFTTDMDNYLSKRSKNFTIEEIKGIAVE